MIGSVRNDSERIESERVESERVESEQAKTRDRDQRGRPRNARPRDALGRPLPYGAVDVPRAAEGTVRTPDESIAEAQRLLDAGMPFHAHEVLEDAWKSAEDGERELWRGLAQLAVGLTHAARGNAKGAAALLTRGAGSIEPYRQRSPHGIDVAGLLAWVASAVRQLDQSAEIAVIDIPAPRLR
jgi:predicted metal-dependent hydrolase